MLERKIWLHVYNVYRDFKITGASGVFGGSNFELLADCSLNCLQGYEL